MPSHALSHILVVKQSLLSGMKTKVGLHFDEIQDTENLFLNGLLELKSNITRGDHLNNGEKEML